MILDPIVNGGVAGVGGAESSIARSKLMRSDDRSETVCPAAGVAVKSVLSSGVGLMSKQPARFVELSCRSFGKLTLETPCSTLYASPAKISSDLFCAFQPKRLVVPSPVARFRIPLMPSDAL